MRITGSSLWLLSFAALAPGQALHAAPLGTAFTYQGRVKLNGTPVNGTANLQLSLWDAAGAGQPPAGGSQIGSNLALNSVPVSDGLFTVSVDFGAAAFSGDARWLQIAVNGQILSPRQPITATPYALGVRLPLAQTVNTASDAINVIMSGTGDCSQFNITNAANVGEAVEARTNGSGDAVQAVNTGTGRAGYFQISNVSNNVAALTGTTNGTGTGVVGLGQVGISGSTTDADGYGGVFGGSGSFGGGQALLVAGDTHMLGSVGIGTTSTIAKVEVTVPQGSSITNAIHATADDTGVWGSSRTGGTGVFGQTPMATGYGVYSSGRFAATGTKALTIDHPLDPANQYLSHYCAEGPDPLLIYRGNATLDAKGEAMVSLPPYFERMNRDYHYQLTPIGRHAPIYVAEEIQNNQFKVAGGEPGMKVSWTVTGIRNDPFVSTYGAPVETLKPAPERGKYLHPDLYGKPQTMALEGPPNQAVR